MKYDWDISIVVAARNDDHGENFLFRMQHFLDGIFFQSQKHQVKVEIIVVEWNPPKDRPFLLDVLKVNKSLEFCTLRFIRVPKEIHDTKKCADKFPLFQMIAKNVGILRAKAPFILATNIDILFSDDLMVYLKKKLKKGRLYRTDRLDIPSNLPQGADFQEILSFCWDNYFRINSKYGTFFRKKSKSSIVKQEFFLFFQILQQLAKKLHTKSIYFVRKNLFKVYKYYKRKQFFKLTYKAFYNFFKIPFRISKFIFSKVNILIPTAASNMFSKIRFPRFKRNLIKLHTNGCGDFTLLSKEDWFKLGGYPEWEMFSWHLDSVFMYMAMHSGIKQVELSKDCSVFHIDHSLGSGYTHEKPMALFDRLKAENIPYLSNEDLHGIFIRCLDRKKPLHFTKENWGCKGAQLQEVLV